jgi:hypothetical protein
VLVLRSIAEATFFGAAGPPPAERLAWLIEEADDFLERAGTRTRLLIRLSLWLVSWLSPWAIFRLGPLRRLELDERVAALARLERSALSAPLLAVKALLSLLYYEHPDASREVGFDGQCLTQVRVRR